MGNYCCGKPSLHETLKKNSSTRISSRKPSTKVDARRTKGVEALNKKTVISIKFLTKESESHALLIRTTLDDKSISKFSDTTFPPLKDSLIPSDPNHYLFSKIPKKLIEEYAEYEWHRLHAIFENKEKIFLSQALTPEDITQGSLGSCYFLCAVGGILKNNIELFKNLFVMKEENKKGIYAVKFLIQGLPQVIVVDDYIPCKLIKNKLTPAFSTSRDKEAAILILEKTWAKINNQCYMKTWLGTPQEALGCLTDAPSMYEYHDRYRTKKQGNLLWIKLCEASLRKWILCANTEEVKEEGGIGLPQFHAYLILDVFEVQKEEEEGYKNFPTLLQDIVENKIEYERNNENCLMLLKIRNPTGDSSKFKGKFHEGSSKWTEGLRRVVGNLDGTKPGTFFITLNEFIKYFSWTFICKLEETYHYKSASFAIEKGYKLIEYRVNKEKTDKKQGKGDEENSVNSWNSDLLEDGIVDTPQINKRIPPNQKASIEKQEIESKNKQENLSIINKSNNNDISPISKRQSDYIDPGIINQITSKKAELSTVNNFEDKYNTIKEINDKLTEPKIMKNQFKLNNIIGATLKIEEKTKCFITLHQPHHRFNYETIKDYQVPLAFIIIVNYNRENGVYQHIKSEFLNWEKLVLDCYLPPGEYHIFAKSYWNVSQPREHQLVLSTYADFPCEIYEFKPDEVSSDWIDRILVNIAKTEIHKTYFSKDEQTSYYTYIMPDYKLSTGFGIFYIENNSLKGQLIVNLNITKSKGIKFLSGNHLSSFAFVIPPKTSKHLIYQIAGPPWESDLKYEQEIWYEYPVHSLMKKFAPQNPEELPRKEIEQHLYLSEIKYDRGYLIMIVNNSGKDYKGKFSFSKMKTFSVDKFHNHKKVEIICQTKSHNYLNIKCNKQEVDPNFKLIYKSNFTLV